MSPKKALKLIEHENVALNKLKSAGVDHRRLISRGLAKAIITTESKFYSPPDAPRWAIKFKFLRKRHGIIEKVEENTSLAITAKGRKFLKDSPKEDKEELSDDPETIKIVEPDDIEPDT